MSLVNLLKDDRNGHWGLAGDVWNGCFKVTIKYHFVNINTDSEKNGINKKIKYLIIAFLTGKILNESRKVVEI